MARTRTWLYDRGVFNWSNGGPNEQHAVIGFGVAVGETVGRCFLHVAQTMVESDAIIAHGYTSRIIYGLYLGDDITPPVTSPGIEPDAWMLHGQLVTQTLDNPTATTSGPGKAFHGFNEYRHETSGQRTASGDPKQLVIAARELFMPSRASQNWTTYWTLRRLMFSGP